MTNLCDEKFFVVGGTSGIGLEFTRLLIKNNASVTISGRNFNGSSFENSEKLRFIKQEFDVSLERPFLDEFMQALKECTVLVICTGPFIQKEFHETILSDWKSMSSLNLALPGFLVSSVLPHMMKARYGKILLFGSFDSERIRGYKTTAAYSSAKTALEVLSRSVNENYAEFNILCRVFHPGFVTNVPAGFVPETASETALEALNLLLT